MSLAMSLKKFTSVVLLQLRLQEAVGSFGSVIVSLENVTSVLCGEISWQFYGKKEVSIETIFIFIFYCATVSRENCMKLAALFSDYFGIKNETG